MKEMKTYKNYSTTRDRLFVVERIIQRHPDGITVAEILKILEDSYGIITYCNTIYDDLNALSRYEPLIVERVGRTPVWKMAKF